MLGNTKHYKKQKLTNLGYQQNFQVGSDYRSRYLEANSPQQILGVSEDEYVASQIYASAPDQSVRKIVWFWIEIWLVMRDSAGHGHGFSPGLAPSAQRAIRADRQREFRE